MLTFSLYLLAIMLQLCSHSISNAFPLHAAFRSSLKHPFHRLNVVHYAHAKIPNNHASIKNKLQSKSRLNFDISASESVTLFTEAAKANTTDNEPDDTTDAKFRRPTTKKKFALVTGFIGTNYFGVQNSYVSNCPTIEEFLFKAIIKANLTTSQDTKDDFYKLNWCRSSRTDRGVSAARLILSMKLDVPHEWIKNVRRVPIMTKMINEHLPPDIRVFSSVKMHNKYDARDSCHWREYEYLLPATIFDESQNLSETQRLLNISLSKFLGIHSFHNFNRLPKREIVDPNRKTPLSVYVDPKQEFDGLEGEEVQNIEVKPEKKTSRQYSDELYKKIEEIFANNLSGVNISTLGGVYSKFLLTQSTIAAKSFSSIYYCKCDEVLNINGQSFFKIVVRGKSFLLNQIRMMISAAVFEVKRISPDYFIDLALDAPFLISIPPIPSEGLLLVGVGMHNLRDDVPPMVLSENSREYTGNEVPFLDSQEFNNSEKFKVESIYDQMQKNWASKVPSWSSRHLVAREKQNISVVEAWFETESYFKAPPCILESWKSAWEATKISKAFYYADRWKKECKRISWSLELLYELLGVKASEIPNMGNMQIAELMKSKKSIINFQQLLPEGFNTAICVRYNVNPGNVTYDSAHVLATDIVMQRIVITENSSIEDVFRLIDNCGGLVQYSNRFRFYWTESYRINLEKRNKYSQQKYVK